MIDYPLQALYHQISFPFYQKENREISSEDINEFEKVLQDFKPNHIFVCCDVDPKKTHLKCFNIIKLSKMINSVKNIWFYKGAWDNWDNKNSIFQLNINFEESEPIYFSIYSFLEISSKFIFN